MGQRDGYSVFVSWAKIILPLSALLILSTLFLFSGRVDVTQSLTYKQLNVDTIVQEQRMSAPYYTGVSQNGTQISVIAAYAVLDDTRPDVFLGTDIDAVLTATDDVQTNVTAPKGQIDNAQDIAHLFGGVIVSTSQDYLLTTDDLDIDFTANVLESRGRVEGTAPFGTIDAGQMRLQDTAHGGLMYFTKGVRLIYDGKTNQK